MDNNFIPLLINENDKTYFSNNQSFKVGKATVENFIN